MIPLNVLSVSESKGCLKETSRLSGELYNYLSCEGQKVYKIISNTRDKYYAKIRKEIEMHTCEPDGYLKYLYKNLPTEDIR